MEVAFGDVTVARKGALIDASVLPGFVATVGGRPVGLLTYEAANGECEVVAIISTEEGRGIGRVLMDAVRDHAAATGCRRLRLITTNDTSCGGWTCVPSTATARAAPGRSNLRCRNAEPKASRWSTNSSSSCPWAAQCALIWIAPGSRGSPEGQKDVTYSLEIPCGYSLNN